VLPDKLLVDLARRPPRNPEALRRRVEQPEVRERADELVALLDRAAEAQPPSRPPVRGPLSPRADAWASGLLLIAALIAGQTQIAQRFLATRADAESLARAFDARGAEGLAEHPVMRGWRRQVIGERFAGWLRGDLRLVTDAASGAAIDLEPSRPGEPASSSDVEPG
jgi:ribonuclease D